MSAGSRAQAGNASASKQYERLLHVTPPKRDCCSVRPISACCNAQASPSQVLTVDEWPALGPMELAGTTSGEKLHDGVLHATPPILRRDFQEMLTDHRGRLEESFRRLLDQQQELQKQMSAMTLAFNSSTDAQALLQARQEDHIAEFHKLLINYPLSDTTKVSTVLETGALVNDGNADALKESATDATEVSTSETAEMVKDGSADALHQSETSAAEVLPSSPEPHAILSSPSKSSIASTPSKRKIRITRGVSSDAMYHNFQHSVSRWLATRQFEIGIALAVLANALFMCWESQYQGLEVGFNLRYPGRPVDAHSTWPGAVITFLVGDWFFGIFFFVEFIVKLVCWQSKYFYYLSVDDVAASASEIRLVRCMGSLFLRCFRGLQYWNLLDCFCVAGFIFSKLAAVGNVNPQMLRLLRLCRLGRLVRLLRILESMDHLYIMTTAIMALKYVLTWAIILVTMMLLTCDLFLVQILHATYFDQITASDLTEEQLLKHQEMYTYFGTWTRCILSMFEITFGNWPPVARLLTEEVSEWFILLCLMHKLTIGFAVIGVINGVILQETFKVAHTDDLIMYREKNKAKTMLRKKLQALFEDLDRSGDGRLEVAEVEHIAESPEIRTWLGALGIETDDLRTLFAMCDANGDGYVTMNELVSRLPRVQGAARSLDVMALLKYTLEKDSQQGKTMFADCLLQNATVLNSRVSEHHSETRIADLLTKV